MRGRQRLSRERAPELSLRPAGFDEVPQLLRLIERAIAHGCRHHYDRTQRRAVFLGYASNLFVDVVRPFDTIVAHVDGRPAAVAQLDAATGTLRALFVDAAVQGRGIGRALLAAVERRACAAGCAVLRGAMSINAVPFYQSAGFRPCRRARTRLVSAGVQVPVTWLEKALRV